MANRGRPPLLSDDEILNRALEMFAASGYSAMSVRALNAELGLSHETVSKRFGPKSDLFRAAVARGVTLFISDLNQQIESSAPKDDGERLRATVRSFMVAASRHPALGDLLHHESIGDEHRRAVISQSGLDELLVETVALLQRLHEAGLIRETKIRDLWFLADGAVAPIRLPGLAQMFDPFDGPLDGEELVDRMTDAIMRSIEA